MAQAVTMGPPLSPRETRRSGRRSAPSASASASKSPDSDPPPKQKEIPHRPSLTTNNSSGRQKRLKQEDLEEAVDDRKNGSAPSTSSASSTHGNTGGRTKRKAKEKDKQPVVEVAPGDAVGGSAEDSLADAPEEEEQGITRCVCGSTGEDDPDAGEFMVQCETCKTWQHGPCMGYESEDQLHDDDYYCEQCRPELYIDLLKKLSKRPRHSSTTSHHNPAPAPSRLSRSHSPSHPLKQPSKRRNTMNSRDAAFDESLKEIIEATAAEAAAVHDTVSVASNGNRDINDHQDNEEDTESGPNSRKKRKRTEDESIAKKRTRSASSASDRQESTVARDDTPGKSKGPLQTPAPAPKAASRANKRGGRKAAAVDPIILMDGEDAPQTGKRQGNNNGRAKGSNVPKRPPASHSVSHGPGSSNHEHGTRRNQTNGITVQSTGSSAAESSRAYRNSHAYVVSQQPLFTSWNLPDYLAHLEEMLPTDTPRPLEVRAGPGFSGSVGTVGGGGRGESIDHTVERGVKVKWPSKRMSVGDMNKRVRALVEWVGREQATALDRSRRRDALEKALREEMGVLDKTGKELGGDGDVALMVDRENMSGSPAPDTILTQAVDQERRLKPSGTVHACEADDIQSSATMKMMEELMDELIRFQERFGPGSKGRERDRERRLVS